MTEPSNAKPYILVVEDDTGTNRLLVKQLTSAGFEAAGVDDGTTALASMAERKPDLVCVDLGLPLVSGFELCRTIRQDPRLGKTPILVVTSRTTLEDITHACEVGADEIVRKPFRRTELVAAVRRLIAPDEGP
jgi:chemosensory pili system protein ChpA (sensor histidine kinase/response regulator)